MADIQRARDLVNQALSQARKAYRALSDITPPCDDVPLPLASATEEVRNAYIELSIARTRLDASPF